jgi:hypothetical protein
MCHGIGEETKKETYVDLAVDETLKTILEQKGEHGLDLSGSGMGAVAGPSEHGNEFKTVHTVYVPPITCIATNSYTILKYNVIDFVRLPTSFDVTSHHPQGKHTEHLKIHNSCIFKEFVKEHVVKIPYGAVFLNEFLISQACVFLRVLYLP